MDLTGKKVLVAGCGTSGAAAAALLREKGSEVLLFEGNERVDVLCKRKIRRNAGAEHRK